MGFDYSFNTHKLGRDDNRWYGKVVDAKHWKPQNDLFMITGLPNARVKVRIIGADPENTTEMGDEDTRWALVSQPAGVGGGSGGRGETISYVGGETVFGHYLDGSDMQFPVITGSIMPAALTAKNLQTDTDNAFDPNYLTKENDDVASFYAHNYNKKAVSQFEWSGVPVFGGELNLGAEKFILNSTNQYNAFTPCGNDTVSRTKKILEDFIEKSNSYEERKGKIIDPLTNEIINMQYDLQVIQERVAGIMTGTINLMRKKIVKNINKAIKDEIKKKKTDPEETEIIDNKDKVKKNKVLELVGCLFDGIFDSIGEFIGNMFTNLLNNVLNGALCAIEQFVAGIFAKVFDAIENALSKIMGALSFLSGGLDKITGLIRSAKGLAKDLLDFLDKCTKDKEKCINYPNLSWTSTSNSAKEEDKDDLEDQIKKVNIFRGIKDGLGNIQKDLIESGKDVSDLDYNGVPLSKTIKATSLLTGGSSNGLIDKGLGSIESAISQSSLFGLGNNRFSACNNTVDNPNSQDDLTPTRPGYIYPKCIPPVVKVSGSGSGAELFAIVGNDRRIFSIEVISGGSGYDESTGISVVDNTGNGVGAYARPIVSNGVITQVVLMKTGYGYCLNTKDDEVSADGGDGVSSVGIGTNVVGTVESIFVEEPGYNYDPNDTVTVGDSEFPIITTPGGSIVDVVYPSDYNYEFDGRANVTINTQTGFAASLIPIMKFKGQLKTDANADKRKVAPLMELKMWSIVLVIIEILLVLLMVLNIQGLIM